MNRLWIRLSLAFSTAILTAIILPIATMVILGWAGVIDLDTIFENERAEEIRALQSGGDIRNIPGGVLRLVLVIGVVCIGTGIWVSRSLTAPITQLAAAAQTVGKKNLSHRVSVAGSKEIVELGRTFNQMVADLEQAEKLRRNLMADVSHELRTPLTVLEGTLRAVLDKVYRLDEEEVANLYSQTRHLIRLVDDLHELARTEAGQLPLNIQEIDIVQLVEETTTIFDPLAEEKGVALKSESAAKAPLLQADEARLRQVLHNLLNNALRHTPRRGTISVHIQRRGDEIAVAIKDTGEGIAPEHLDQVFNRFYRTDRSRSRDTGGTGLGLPIVKAIIEAHGGRIDVASQGVGQGSTFTVFLPQ